MLRYRIGKRGYGVSPFSARALLSTLVYGRSDTPLCCLPPTSSLNRSVLFAPLYSHVFNNKELPVLPAPYISIQSKLVNLPSFLSLPNIILAAEQPHLLFEEDASLPLLALPSQIPPFFRARVQKISPRSCISYRSSSKVGSFTH